MAHSSSSSQRFLSSSANSVKCIVSYCKGVFPFLAFSRILSVKFLYSQSLTKGAVGDMIEPWSANIQRVFHKLRVCLLKVRRARRVAKIFFGLSECTNLKVGHSQNPE